MAAKDDFNYDDTIAKIDALDKTLSREIRKVGRCKDCTDADIEELARRHEAWLGRVIKHYTAQISNVKSLREQIEQRSKEQK